MSTLALVLLEVVLGAIAAFGIAIAVYAIQQWLRG